MMEVNIPEVVEEVRAARGTKRSTYRAWARATAGAASAAAPTARRSRLRMSRPQLCPSLIPGPPSSAAPYPRARGSKRLARAGALVRRRETPLAPALGGDVLGPAQVHRR